MTDRPCLDCRHYRVVQPIVEGMLTKRCFRPRAMRSGQIILHENIGTAASQERDGLPEPQRKLGDKCGPLATHWQAAKS